MATTKARARVRTVRIRGRRDSGSSLTSGAGVVVVVVVPIKVASKPESSRAVDMKWDSRTPLLAVAMHAKSPQQGWRRLTLAFSTPSWSYTVGCQVTLSATSSRLSPIIAAHDSAGAGFPEAEQTRRRPPSISLTTAISTPGVKDSTGLASTTITRVLRVASRSVFVSSSGVIETWHLYFPDILSVTL